MQVRNAGLAGAELNNAGVAYKADEHGVFDVPDNVGEMLLTLPGYARPRDTLEKRRAYVAFKQAEAAHQKAETALEDARGALLAAQMQADRGEGTEPEGAASNGAAATTPVPSAAAPKARQAAKAAVATKTRQDVAEHGGAIVPSPEVLKAKHGGEPTMKWPVEDLRAYARGLGIDAQDEWHKVQLYAEIEALNGE